MAPDTSVAHSKQPAPHCANADTESETGGRRPFLTIAIPTFNRASWLRECVLSALGQSYEHFEVLVSDNASTDDTATVLAGIRDPRLRVLRQASNIGQTPNWNTCLREAEGDYIVFVSDDDKIAPWMLERCAQLIERESHILVIVALGNVYVADEDLILPEIASHRYSTGVWDGADILEEFLTGRISPQMCTVMIRTDTLRTRGGFPTEFPHTGDLAAWVPLLLLGRAGFINEQCGTYREHNATTTSTFTIEVRLRDLEKLASLISDAAGQTLRNGRQRRRIRSHARRYVARHALGYIASHRRDGATLAETLPLMWQWRSHLIRAGMGNVSALPRPVALLLLPRPLTQVLRRLLRKLKHAH